MFCHSHQTIYNHVKALVGTVSLPLNVMMTLNFFHVGGFAQVFVGILSRSTVTFVSNGAFIDIFIIDTILYH